MSRRWLPTNDKEREKVSAPSRPNSIPLFVDFVGSDVGRLHPHRVLLFCFEGLHVRAVGGWGCYSVRGRDGRGVCWAVAKRREIEGEGLNGLSMHVRSGEVGLAGG